MKRCPICDQAVRVVAGRLGFHYVKHGGFAEMPCEGSHSRAYPLEMADDLNRDTHGVPYDAELRAADELMNRRLYGEPRLWSIGLEGVDGTT